LIRVSKENLMTTTGQTTSLDDRIIGATTGALELFSIHLGRQLGLYEAVKEGVTVDGLATSAAIYPRYAREWLEQQAVAGFVNVDDETASWDRRVYSLDDSQVATFLEADDLAHVSPLADMIVGVGGVIGKVADAFRSGAGVPYAEYGPIFRDGQANINRPAFRHELVPNWVIPAVPDIADRLSRGGKVADLGCGVGWSTIALTAGFPTADVVGYDSDVASIEDAVALATSRGVEVAFKAANASALVDDGPFDLIVILEALHDMSQPGLVLEATRRALAPGGAVLVADEAVGDTFSTTDGELDPMFYGWSVVHCLPAAMAESPSAAIGTVIRPSYIEAFADEAGFDSFEKTDIDGGFFHIYVLR
jgi:2-polyprenyl-3-methyl-5-hydroxy-6-metoxy-1,4-benzoquinol methylase